MCEDNTITGYYAYLNHWVKCDEAANEPMEPIKAL
jgi:hypothetical protein